MVVLAVPLAVGAVAARALAGRLDLGNRTRQWGRMEHVVVVAMGCTGPVAEMGIVVKILDVAFAAILMVVMMRMRHSAVAVAAVQSLVVRRMTGPAEDMTVLVMVGDKVVMVLVVAVAGCN
jgi:hypothetical protein